MSQLLIQHYLNQLADLRTVSGTHRESVVREAFKDLLKGYARSHDLVFIPEYEVETKTKERRYVDGALLHPGGTADGCGDPAEADARNCIATSENCSSRSTRTGLSTCSSALRRRADSSDN